MSKKIKFSLITSTVLVLSSFIPILQILIMYLNSFIVQPIGKIFGINDNIAIYGLNSVFSIGMIVLFYFSSSSVQKIFSIIGVIIFLMPLLMYSTTDIISTEKYYFIQFLIIGIITGLILIGLEYLRSKKAAQ